MEDFKEKLINKHTYFQSSFLSMDNDRDFIGLVKRYT